MKETTSSAVLCTAYATGVIVIIIDNVFAGISKRPNLRVGQKEDGVTSIDRQAEAYSTVHTQHLIVSPSGSST